MKKIFIFGSGRSTSALISYLEEHARDYNWKLTIADRAATEVSDNEVTARVQMDVFDEQALNQAVHESDLVISMLPAMFHPVVARACLKHNRNMLTASYVSHEIGEMDTQVKSHQLLFLNEMGVDPG